MTATNITIGIDPGKKTGFAIYDHVAKKFLHLESTDFWGAFNGCINLRKSLKTDRILVVVELPTTRANFGRRGGHTTSTHIGGVIREAELLSDGLRKHGFNVLNQHPKGKITQKEFADITGYTGRTNEHTRDAAMLAFSLKFDYEINK